MRKRDFGFGLMIIVLFFLISLVSASFLVNEKTINITEIYGPGSFLKGVFNLSLEDENFNSALSAFDSNITIKKFLDNNGLGSFYDCSTQNCGMTYTGTNAQPSKSFSLSNNAEKLIGLKISGGFGEVNSLFLNLSTNAGASCTAPIKVDIKDDGIFEWISSEPADEFTCFDSYDYYGCYQPSSQKASISGKYYCEQIEIPAFPNVMVGADLIAVDSSRTENFEMLLRNDNYDEVCTFTASGSGEQGCVIEISTLGKQIFNVCIRSLEEKANYQIGIENTEPCGYAGTDEDEFTNDFAIYAKSGKYASVASFALTTAEVQKIDSNMDSLESIISEYIDDEYNNDCENDCVIPINIVSGATQNLVLSDLTFSYDDEDGITLPLSNIYDLQEKESVISMSSKKVDLSKAMLKVPTKYGEHELKLKLDGQTIITKDIEILETPVINNIFPQKAPAALDIVFRAYVSGKNITKYTWKFGDNSSSQVTNANKTIHKYSQLGKYTLELSVENSLGSSTKIIEVEVIDPEEYIELILNESEEGIENVKSQLNDFPEWIKEDISSRLNLNYLESELVKLRADYEAAGGSTSAFVGILSKLDTLEVPKSVSLANSVSGKFFIDPGKIDVSSLSSLGAGESNGNADEYRKSIFSWAVDNFNLEVHQVNYFVLLNGAPSPLVSVIKLSISPKQSVSDVVYLVINKPKSSISFKDSTLTTQEAGQTTGIVLNGVSSKMEIDFIIGGEEDGLDAPIYLSPKFSQLSLGFDFDVCDNDGVCETGENSANCRKDCKPWTGILLWLFILVFIAFIFYVLLQEWYKKKYEHRLFKNKDELFNVVNFMDNAEKQGLSKGEIFTKLRGKNWDNEQLSYAWKKYKGKRTGMWEIPVFTFFEKMKLKKEILKKRNQGQTGNIAPIAPQNYAQRPRVAQIRPPLDKQNINKPQNSFKYNKNGDNLGKK